MLNVRRLAERLSDAQATEVVEWWHGLGQVDRRELHRDRGRPPARVVVRFIEPGEDLEVGEDFYEYLVNHEVFIDDGPTYHICTAHPEARAVVAAGRIPCTFRCPRREEGCPMRALLDRCPGHDVQFELVRERGR
jgi:hypothetical protein